MTMTRKLLGLAAACAILAGCAAQPVTIPSAPDVGYAGGDAVSTGPIDANVAGVGTLPGSNAPDRVFFAYDQSTLSGEAIATLDAQVAWMNANPASPVRIEGHADERGTRDYNLQLGSARASAVRNYMVSRGVPDARISVITYGRERPVATCAQESCFAENRRAVTVVVAGAAGS
jgi:peptidoglycan-associated lipoprotein